MATAVQRYKKAIDEVRELYMLIGYIYRKDNYTPKAWEPNMIIDYLKYLKGNFADEIKAEITSGTNSKKDVIFRLDVVFSELGKLSDDISFFTPFDFWATDKQLFKGLMELRGETWAKEIIKAIDEVINIANAKINDVRYMLERMCEWCGYDNKKQANFRGIIQYEDPDKLLKRLHELIDGCGGADVGSVLYKAYLEKYITRTPTENECRGEFDIKGTWKAISNYMNPNNTNTDKRTANVVIFNNKQS